MGETPFQNPANDEADEQAGESPGERAQRLYEQQSGTRLPGADAGPLGDVPGDDDTGPELPPGDGAPAG